tara:strand:- start:510 stop:623 length:114 start_codon:yes stop_codon:yes gene_type:complete
MTKGSSMSHLKSFGGKVALTKREKTTNLDVAKSKICS